MGTFIGDFQMLQGTEELYTLVDEDNHPVYTDAGMDGHFVLAESFGSMLTFTKKIGWGQMMEMASWSHKHHENGRKKVYPAKITLTVERLPCIQEFAGTRT